MREKILEDLKAAMKAQDKETLTVIRMVKGAIQMEELNVNKEERLVAPFEEMKEKEEEEYIPQHIRCK